MIHPASARLEARLPVEIHTLLKRAAALEGRTLTDFVVSAAHEAAKRAITENSIVFLSLEDQQRLAEAILNPPEPVPALQRAFQKHHDLFGSR